MYLTDLADILRAAGVKVREHDGWKTRGHGPLSGFRGIVWHHDASPKGDSPGVADYMLRGMSNPDSPGDAQVWVDRYGVWHLLGAGKAWHAGRVNDDRFSNSWSIGIETDHTTGEDWPAPLLDSLRAGTAAIFKAKKLGVDALGFHKTVCVPAGRKTDPDGLDLARERQFVAGLMSGPTPAPKPASTSTSAAAAPKAETQAQYLARKHANDAACELVWGALPLPSGHWYGPASKDVRNHSGYWAKDQRAVKQVQRTVGAPVSGSFDAATKAAVMAWQKTHGLPADGGVGAQTWTAMAR